MFSALKAIKTDTRNSLSLQQLERLLILGGNLPEKLSDFNLEKMTELMSKE